MIKPIVILATGGSGGHIFPALALKEALEKSYHVIIVADQRSKIFIKNYDKNKTFFLAITNLKRHGLWHKIMSILKFGFSIIEAFLIIKAIKPTLVIGFGGYPSFPTVIVAQWLKIPSIIHEQNSLFGKANKYLAKNATFIATSFKNVSNLASKYQNKTVLVGNPVRKDIADLRLHDYQQLQEDQQIKIFVIGGSQGATIFSEVIPEALALIGQKLRSRISVVQQARVNQVIETRKRYQQLGINAKVESFFDNVAEIIDDATLIIARAGASTIAELLSSCRPAILIPYPLATANHQWYNAQDYLAKAAGWLIEQKDFQQNTLAQKLNLLFANPKMLQHAHQQAKNHYIDSTAEFCLLIEKVIY